MAARAVSESTTDIAGGKGTLFKDFKFWVSQKVPQRARFVNEIKANGGEVYPLEKQADVLIVDHARKEAPAGTTSYRFIEQSIRNGMTEHLADHAVGGPKGTVRSIGSVVQPPKGTRQKYTQEDERILWDWVNAYPQKTGGTDGNEVYKLLEAEHPQHPWQSWRDHFIKQMKHKPRPVYPPSNAPPTPPLEMLSSIQTGELQRPVEHADMNEDEFDTFSEKDAQSLLEYGQVILDIFPGRESEAWAKWAETMDPETPHTSAQWRAFWEQVVRPRFLRRKAKQANRAAAKESSSPEPIVSEATETKAATTPTETKNNAHVPRSSLSGPPESPKLRAREPTVVQEVVNGKLPLRTTPEKPKDGINKNASSPIGNTFLKRKSSAVEEVPSSSPPQLRLSRVPKGQDGPKKRKEIASTPDRSPKRNSERKQFQLFLGDAGEEDEALPDQGESDDDLGQEPSESLSEPDRTTHPTQQFFREPTPFIDLEVATPEEGWDDRVGGNETHSESEGESQYETAQDDQQPVLPDTQDVFKSRTQVPDLDVPDPDGGWDTMLPSSPPTLMPSSPPAESENQSSSSNDEAGLDIWIKNRVAAGFTEEQAEEVFKRACMDTKLAEEVFQYMKIHNGEMPNHTKGFWTEEDDQDFYSTDARKIGRLERKHGAECLSSRWEFLDAWGKEK